MIKPHQPIKHPQECFQQHTPTHNHKWHNQAMDKNHNLSEIGRKMKLTLLMVETEVWNGFLPLLNFTFNFKLSTHCYSDFQVVERVAHKLG